MSKQSAGAGRLAAGSPVVGACLFVGSFGLGAFTVRNPARTPPQLVDAGERPLRAVTRRTDRLAATRT